ncbi:MAG: hypothetical protein ACW98D_06420, partial [Promethearchaeota archaeon]
MRTPHVLIMRPHHRRAIENLKESIKKDEDSDIDVTLIATDEEFEKRKKRDMFLYYETKFCDYPGGYIDGKVVNLEFLQTIAERGSEPARDAFRDTWIAYSNVPELENLLKKIPIF